MKAKTFPCNNEKMKDTLIY